MWPPRSPGCGVRRPVARPRDLHAPSELLDEVVRPGRRAAGGHGAQATHPLRGRRLHGRDLRDPDRRGLHALARDRVRGSRARDRGRSLARPRGARERVHGPRAEGADQLRAGALRRDRCGHQLGQAPRRRARAPTTPGAWSSTARSSPGSARASTRPAPSEPSRWTGRWRRSPRWPTRRARPAPPRSPPSAPQGCAPRRTPPSSCSAAESRCGRPDRDHPRRGGGPPRLPRGHDGARAAAGSLVVFDTGGGSSQFTFGDEDAIAEQFSVPVGAVRLTERYRARSRRVRRAAPRRARPDRRRARPPRRPPRARRARSGWAAR